MLRSIDREKCIGCGSCFKTCAFDVFRLDTCQEKIPPCTGACPAGIDMRGYMYQLQLGDHAKAATRMLERNALPYLTCRICSHYCEKACTRKKVDAPVNIPAIEAYLCAWLDAHDPVLPPINRSGKVIVAGSGAAGLSAAWFMRLNGFRVEVHEKNAAAGGSLVNDVPADILETQLNFLKRHDIAIMTNSAIGDGHDLTPRKLLHDHTRALIIATGTATAGEFASVVDMESDKIVADPVTRTTRTNGVFAVGSCTGTPMGIAHLMRDGFEAAWSARCFADGWDMIQGRPPKRMPIFEMPVDMLFPYNEKLPIGNLPPMPRNEVRQGQVFDYETAMLETHRCVTCGSKARAAYKNDCMTCFFCEISCPVEAIKVDPIKEEIPRTIEFKREGVN